jgi:immune inhibitor A
MLNPFIILQLRAAIRGGYNRLIDMNTPQPSDGDKNRRHAWRWFSVLVVSALLMLGGLMWGIRSFGDGRSLHEPIRVPTDAEIVDDTEGPRGLDGKQLPTPTLSLFQGKFLVPAEIDQRPLPDRAVFDLDRLYTTIVPIHDYFVAAEMLGGFDLGERQISREAYQLGERAIFNTADGSRQAELVYLDDLAYYWVETGLNLNREAIVQSAERLRTQYYPRLVNMFGQEWRPGVDGDLRFSVLHVLGSPDAHELGYFIDENSYPASLFNKSNVQEMVYLNMSRLEAGTPIYEGTLVHEIQHLIQWNLDANEATWINEGLSQIAETLVGLNTIDPNPYLEQPDIRLDHWSSDPTDVFAHYAGSYLYLLYLWEQAGDAALRELARHPANGLAAIRAVLAGHRPDLSLETFTGDWATANYLDSQFGDSPFAYHGVDLNPPRYSRRVSQVPHEITSSLDQFAVDYIDLGLNGRVVITFAGDTVAALIPSPPDGDEFWYAIPANSGQAQLTAEVDLSELKTASWEFSIWYDLEDGYDFAYTTISTDGGQTWRLLKPRNAIVGSYGPALSGRSTAVAGNQDGWIRESIALDPFAGQSILLRYAVVTDFEVIGQGLGIADLEIVGLASQPNWIPAGFARTGALLPQEWEVRVIRKGKTPEVFPLKLNDKNQGQFAVDFGNEGGTLVIVPLNPFVESAANYWLRFEE